MSLRVRREGTGRGVEELGGAGGAHEARFVLAFTCWSIKT